MDSELISEKIRITGMYCINCQERIEKTLKKTPGVKQVSVSYAGGSCDISYYPDKISRRQIEKIIKDLGYGIAEDAAKTQMRFVDAAGLLFIIAAAYFLLNKSGILNLLVPDSLADSSMGYGMLFVTGLITSVHCIAMCGGINLSQSLPSAPAVKNENPQAKQEKAGRFAFLLPSVLYNLGRVISYTVIGAFLGLLGMLLGTAFNITSSGLLQGIVKIIAGTLMLIMGINMLGAALPLRKLTFRLPSKLTRKAGKKAAKSKSPFIVGLLNGLMPCGPLQSMQLVALAAANPFTGALSMLMFSLGTVPLMLGLGTIVSVLGKKFAKTVFNLGAVLVAVMGLAMLSQGTSLSGLISDRNLFILIIAFCAACALTNVKFNRKYILWLCEAAVICAALTVIAAGNFTKNASLSASEEISSEENLSGENQSEEDETAESSDDIQIVESTLSSGKYPNIEVKAGTPVKWIIYAEDGTINGCNYKFYIKEYGTEYTFSVGENIIEFTPEEAGTYTYTCWMGMIKGEIVVTE